MTSDPKHLPPRDCLVLYHTNGHDAIIHALHMSNPDPHHDSGWFSAETGMYLDPSRVITWRELPEVE